MTNTSSSSANEGNEAAVGSQENTQPQIAIQRVFVKDLSFESPNSLESFTLGKPPQAEVEITTNSQTVGENAYEVVVKFTVTAKHDEKVTYLVEVVQAGLFHIANVPEESMGQALGAFCPNILFPYARTTIDGVLAGATFPPLHLAPVNFDALYAQNVARQQQAAQQPVAENQDDDGVTVY